LGFGVCCRSVAHSVFAVHEFFSACALELARVGFSATFLPEDVPIMSCHSLLLKTIIISRISQLYFWSFGVSWSFGHIGPFDYW